MMRALAGPAWRVLFAVMVVLAGCLAPVDDPQGSGDDRDAYTYEDFDACGHGGPCWEGETIEADWPVTDCAAEAEGRVIQFNTTPPEDWEDNLVLEDWQVGINWQFGTPYAVWGSIERDCMRVVVDRDDRYRVGMGGRDRDDPDCSPHANGRVVIDGPGLYVVDLDFGVGCA